MSNRTLSALLVLAFAAGGAAAEVSPDTVMAQAIAEPTAGYTGHAVTTRWFGDRAQSSEYRISYMPPGRYRREYLLPDGALDSVTVSDGSREWIYFPRKGKFLSGDAAKSGEKLLKPEVEERLLRDNYTLALSSAERVAGREAWLLTLTSKRAGKCRQTFSVDKRTGAVLASRRYLPGGRLATLFKFTRFEAGSQPLERFARPHNASTAAVHQLDPNFMTLTELDRALGEPARFPTNLPGGFVFESADFFTIGAQTVKHARYTDGLAVVSIFQTKKPVRISAETAGAGADSLSALRLSAAGHVLRVKAHGRQFTVVSDVAAALLKEIASGLQKNAN